MSTGPVRGLVLDLDDTLLDTRAAMVSAGSLVAAALWPDADPVAWRGFGERYCEDPHQFYERYARGELAFPDMRRQRFTETRDFHGLPDVGERFDTFEADYWGAFQHSQQLFDDTVELLDTADARGVRMVLLTNSSQVLAEMKTREAGITERFVATLTTDTFGVGKPDPRLFAMATDALELDPAEILSVGDHLGRDITPALTAGMQAAWLVRPDGRETVPDVLDERVRVVASLGEVSALLG